jgi:hypothetical protein
MQVCRSWLQERWRTRLAGAIEVLPPIGANKVRYTRNRSFAASQKRKFNSKP